MDVEKADHKNGQLCNELTCADKRKSVIRKHNTELRKSKFMVR